MNLHQIKRPVLEAGGRARVLNSTFSRNNQIEPGITGTLSWDINNHMWNLEFDRPQPPMRRDSLNRYSELFMSEGELEAIP